MTVPAPVGSMDAFGLSEHLKPALEAHAVVLLAQSAEDLFHRCVSMALHSTRATTAVLLLFRPHHDALEVVAASGHHSDEALGLLLPRGQGLSWQVFSSGEALLIDQAYRHQAAHFVAGHPQAGAYLGVPLLDPDGHALGVLSVDTTNSDEVLGADDSRTLTLLAQAAGVAYSRHVALELAQANARKFERLAQLSAEIEGLEDPDEIARHALQTLIDLSGFTTGAMFTLDDHEQTALHLLVGDVGDSRLAEAWVRHPHAPEGVVAEVMTTRKVVSVHQYAGWTGAAQVGGRGVYSAVAAPLHAAGRLVGVIGLLHVHHVHGGPPGVGSLLEMVVARIERATERVRAQEHLRDMREAALRAVGRVLEGRDGETYGHTDRVTALALQLGEVLHLTDDERQHLRWGAYLHDIGKVTVPDAILLKPGALTPEERQTIEQHVVIGDGMLRDEVFVPREVRAVVRSHHERWDGRGYPDGLHGEQIPLLARIFSVVDVYDALISERPYKRAWSHDDAIAELKRSAGTQFDPRVVEAFCALATLKVDDA
ncbi:HD domain-containing protein [Deinococcus sp. KSM4-11]|uniref:HD domain-containing phosphohydrolase n=1 Tax=Deinococcus sp. KSM4-11 TaxID=2568654 RepID=UPI0010A3C7D4|nr:HD domain-containing phosphohydrolase [Deinococcus sp. KSM4-11]THF88930.1 HD domain-containing protein [Deinococcus sp. KSM4-11]